MHGRDCGGARGGEVKGEDPDESDTDDGRDDVEAGYERVPAGNNAADAGGGEGGGDVLERGDVAAGAAPGDAADDKVVAAASEGGAGDGVVDAVEEEGIAVTLAKQTNSRSAQPAKALAANDDAERDTPPILDVDVNAADPGPDVPTLQSVPRSWQTPILPARQTAVRRKKTTLRQATMLRPMPLLPMQSDTRSWPRQAAMGRGPALLVLRGTRTKSRRRGKTHNSSAPPAEGVAATGGDAEDGNASGGDVAVGAGDTG